MLNHNKILLALLSLSAILVAAVLEENLKAISRPPAEAVKTQDEAPLPAASNADIEKIKDAINKAGIVPHPAMHWKNN